MVHVIAFQINIKTENFIHATMRPRREHHPWEFGLISAVAAESSYRPVAETSPVPVPAAEGAATPHIVAAFPVVEEAAQQLVAAFPVAEEEAAQHLAAAFPDAEKAAQQIVEAFPVAEHQRFPVDSATIA